jgi:CBS domain-containing protein
MALDLNAELASHLASSFIDPKLEVISFQVNTPLSKVIDTLSGKHIQSAPVYDANKQCLGLIDLCDIVAFLVHMLYKKAGIDAAQASQDTLAGFAFPRTEFEDGKGMSYRFKHQPVQEIINFSKQNPYMPVGQQTPLRDVVRALATVRRVPVVDGEGQVRALISQSSIVTWLAKRIDKVPFAPRTLEELGVARKKVITINSSARTLDAFAILHSSRVSALTVVDVAGKMCGVISLRDISLASADMHNLLVPVVDFVKHQRSLTILATPPTIEAYPEHTFGLVVQRLHAVKIHRLYVGASASDPRPVGVVSVGDIVRVVAQQLQLSTCPPS